MGKRDLARSRHMGEVILGALLAGLLLTPLVPFFTADGTERDDFTAADLAAPGGSAVGKSAVIGSADAPAEEPPAATLPAQPAAPAAPAELADPPASPPPETLPKEETPAPEAGVPEAPSETAPASSAGETEGGQPENQVVSGSVSVSAGQSPYLPAEETAPGDDGAASTDGADAPPEDAAPPEAPAGDEYFDDTVFLGDSRTEGFRLYSGLKTGQYLCSVGATVSSVFTKATEETDAGKVPILDALDRLEFSKVYVMLGINELGWPHTEQFHDQFCKIVDRIRATHPDAVIVLQSILPVSSRQDAKGNYVNNARIREYNQVIAQVAEETGCTYLDVGAGLAGEDGCLPSDQNFDGVHLNVAGCKKWLEFLRENPV